MRAHLSLLAMASLIAAQMAAPFAAGLRFHLRLQARRLAAPPPPPIA